MINPLSLPVLLDKPKAAFNRTIICLAYPSDLDNIYAFFCARYKDVSFEDFLNIGLSEFNKKLNSIPKDEPLFEIIQSRVINISKIKNKEERKRWRELKRLNRIPQIYLSTAEIENILKEGMQNGFKKIK